MEFGNESQSAMGMTGEGNKHLARKISIFSLEPIKFTQTHELRANLIKLKWGCLSEGSQVQGEYWQWYEKHALEYSMVG